MSEALHHLDRALAGLQRALEARPHVAPDAFTEATQAVCAYRDDQRWRVRAADPGPEPTRRLKAANVAVTLLLAGHYPLGEMPWDALESLQRHLLAMRADEAAEAQSA